MVAVVLAVVGAASAVARYADTHQAPVPAPLVPRPAATSTADAGTIEFTTARGSGRLVLVDHVWEPAPPGAGPRARHLRIRVELLCTRGSVGHAPEFFSLFDDRGRLVEASLAVVEPDPVPLGTLGPGERVRGHVAFDLPRGDVTLVMSDEVSSVTAIRVPG